MQSSSIRNCTEFGKEKMNKRLNRFVKLTEQTPQVRNIIDGILHGGIGLLSEPVVSGKSVPPPLFMVGVFRGVVRGTLGLGVKVLAGFFSTGSDVTR